MKKSESIKILSYITRFNNESHFIHSSRRYEHGDKVVNVFSPPTWKHPQFCSGEKCRQEIRRNSTQHYFSILHGISY